MVGMHKRECQNLLFLLLLSLTFFCCAALSKYSKEANLPDETENWKNVEKPFRLAKVNLVWAKAQKVRYFAVRVCLHFLTSFYFTAFIRCQIEISV